MDEYQELDDPREIPSEFYNFSTGKPFDTCIDCGKYLLDGEPYMIEKAIRQYEGYTAKDIIFEYAICVSCAEKMKNELSKESMANIQTFFTENINPEIFWAGKETEECLVTGDSKEKLGEYQIYAYCNGKHLSQFQPPFMISGAVLDKVADLLSDETIDELNRFMDEHFPPPPELEDLPLGRKLIFI